MTASTHSSTSTCRHVEHIQLGNRLLRCCGMELKTGKSHSSIYKGVSEGTFPTPVPIGDNSVAWLEKEGRSRSEPQKAAPAFRTFTASF